MKCRFELVIAFAVWGALVMVGCPGGPGTSGTPWVQAESSNLNKFHPKVTVTAIGGDEVKVQANTMGSWQIKIGTGGFNNIAGSSGDVIRTVTARASNPKIVDTSGGEWMQFCWQAGDKRVAIP